jgi:hypothetical protein
MHRRNLSTAGTTQHRLGLKTKTNYDFEPSQKLDRRNLEEYLFLDYQRKNKGELKA